jgi:DNA-binding IscR family transcriptional regulator
MLQAVEIFKARMNNFAERMQILLQYCDRLYTELRNVRLITSLRTRYGRH